MVVGGIYMVDLFQIVSTLVGDRQNTDKMLLYAENHNQVATLFLLSCIYEFPSLSFPCLSYCKGLI